MSEKRYCMQFLNESKQAHRARPFYVRIKLHLKFNTHWGRVRKSFKLEWSACEWKCVYLCASLCSGEPHKCGIYLRIWNSFLLLSCYYIAKPQLPKQNLDLVSLVCTHACSFIRKKGPSGTQTHTLTLTLTHTKSCGSDLKRNTLTEWYRKTTFAALAVSRTTISPSLGRTEPLLSPHTQQI